MKYKKNIALDYWHTLFRSLNVTQGIWMIYLYSKGFDIFEIALFEVIFHIASLLLEIPTGAIADVFGRKASRILGILSYFVYIAIIINSTSFYAIGIAFVFCGLSYVFESGAAEAIVYDSLIQMDEEKQFMKVNGRKEAIYQISGFVALMVSGVIASSSHELNFYITGGFFIVAMLFILFMKEVPVERLDKPTFLDQFKNQFIISTKTVLQNKRLFLLIVIGALMLAPITTIFFFLQNYFDIGGVPLPLITVFLGLHAGAAAIGGLVAHKLEKKYGEKKILYLVPLLIVISFWLMLFDSVLVIVFVFVGVLDSVFYVVLSDYINKMVSSEERATVLSFFGMAFSLVMIVVFAIIGYIIEYVSFNTAFMILAVIVTIFYMILFALLKGNHLDEAKPIQDIE